MFKEEIIRLCHEKKINNVEFIRMTYLFSKGTFKEIDKYLTILVQSTFDIYQEITEIKAQFSELKLLKNGKSYLLLGILGKDCFINISVGTYSENQNHNLHIEISSTQGLIDFDPENDKAFTGPNQWIDYFEGITINELCVPDYLKEAREEQKF
ncbi:MAG: hypothetical protein IC227_07060 [Enterococcus lacertideformus]|uniref:Uncharacterized protein n=1 Tax=Enterococcus lacertideformus TaxID=2771493 RepID=A0A931FB56_9ENTE|nr:hypothetical protein [Enterococcus lacertideformus]